MFHSDALFRTSLATATAIHALLLGFCCALSFKSIKPLHPKPISKAKLSVQTIDLTPSIAVADIRPSGAAPSTPSTRQPARQPIEKKQTTPPPEPKPKPKLKPKEPPKAIAKVVKANPKAPPIPKPAKSTQKAQEAPKPTQNPPPAEARPKPLLDDNRKQLLARARESIGKIQTSGTVQPQQKNQTVSLGAPQLIGQLQSESVPARLEISYQDVLINRLKDQLQMPEYGDVDIEITITRSGKILRYKILRDENKTNRQYIEKAIPSLQLPPFGKEFEGESQHTFIITLSNDF